MSLILRCITFPVMLSRTQRAFLRFFLVIQGWPFPLFESNTHSYSVIPAILSGLVTTKPKLWLTAGPPYNLIYGFTHTQQDSWPPLSTPSPSAFSRPNSSCLSGEGFPILLPSLLHLVLWVFLPPHQVMFSHSRTRQPPLLSQPSLGRALACASAQG